MFTKKDLFTILMKYRVGAISFPAATIHIRSFLGRLFRFVVMSEFPNTVYVIFLRVGVVRRRSTLRRGDYRNEMRRVIGNRTRLAGLNFPNKAWHSKR